MIFPFNLDSEKENMFKTGFDLLDINLDEKLEAAEEISFDSCVKKWTIKNIE